ESVQAYAVEVSERWPDEAYVAEVAERVVVLAPHCPVLDAGGEQLEDAAEELVLRGVGDEVRVLAVEEWQLRGVEDRPGSATHEREAFASLDVPAAKAAAEEFVYFACELDEEPVGRRGAVHLRR